MRRRGRRSAPWGIRTVACLIGGALLLGACTAGTRQGPAPTRSVPSAPSSTASGPSASRTAGDLATASKAPLATATLPNTPGPATQAPSPLPSPGAGCDPAGGDPNCTDSADPGHFEYVYGYADCLKKSNLASGGVCADLDLDGFAGYPDHG